MNFVATRTRVTLGTTAQSCGTPSCCCCCDCSQHTILPMEVENQKQQQFKCGNASKCSIMRSHPLDWSMTSGLGIKLDRKTGEHELSGVGFGCIFAHSISRWCLSSSSSRGVSFSFCSHPLLALCAFRHAGIFWPPCVIPSSIGVDASMLKICLLIWMEKRGSRPLFHERRCSRFTLS